MEPFLIHWSNVVDYIHPHDFHAIAKNMSGPDTVHILHSCNWTSRVYGTDIYDIDKCVRLHYYSAGLMSMKTSASVIERVGIVDMYPSHFRSVCAHTLTRQFVKKFFVYFFEGEQVTCGCTGGKVPLKLPDPFSRNDDTAHFHFAYKNTGVTFRGDTYDFFNDE